MYWLNVFFLHQLPKEVQPLLGLSHNGVYVNVPLQVLGDGGAQEPEWLHCSHRAVHDGESGESRGVSPEVHDHLHCFECVKIEVVKTAPDSQLYKINLRILFIYLLNKKQTNLRTKILKLLSI